MARLLTSKAAILVSPGPIDGYPPVPNQAILLTEAGFGVHIITQLASAGDATPVGDRLKQRARELGVEHRVELNGWTNAKDSANATTKTDIGICPFRNVKNDTALGASNKRYQYMQAGLAQIRGTTPRVARMLEGNGIGVSVISFQPQAIADAVNIDATDPHRTRREGALAYELFKSRQSYETSFPPVMDSFKREIAATS